MLRFGYCWVLANIDDYVSVCCGCLCGLCILLFGYLIVCGVVLVVCLPVWVCFGCVWVASVVCVGFVFSVLVVLCFVDWYYDLLIALRGGLDVCV